MRGMSKLMWVTAGVSTVGVVAGVGLMFAGDWLGRRDEAILRAAVSLPASTPSTMTRSTPGPAPSLHAQPAPQASRLSGARAGEPLPAIKLTGTMLADDPKNSTAVIEQLERETRTTMRLGEAIGAWVLTAIDRGWVLFKTADGHEMKLELEDQAARADAGILSRVLSTFQGGASGPEPAAIAQAAQAITVVSDQERLVDRQRIIEATKGNPFQLLSQTSMVPHLAGAHSGFRVTSVAESPWTRQVGMEVGDVVTAINGKPVFDLRKMSEIASDLLSAPNVDITIQRADQEMRLQYHMQPSANAAILQGSP